MSRYGLVMRGKRLSVQLIFDIPILNASCFNSIVDFCSDYFPEIMCIFHLLLFSKSGFFLSLPLDFSQIRRRRENWLGGGCTEPGLTLRLRCLQLECGVFHHRWCLELAARSPGKEFHCIAVHSHVAIVTIGAMSCFSSLLQKLVI